MERVAGLETEYGLSATADGRRLSAPEAAELLFAPLVAEYRGSNAFLPNGGRLYLDVGAHPEYATPECRSAAELLVAERAGDELMAELARRATARAAAAGQVVRLRLFKNNLDSHGNSYGCHENYLLSRSVELPGLVELLTPFLVTRQLFCGAGSYRRGRFRLSQRADHLHDQLSAQTTRLRPLVNTRDEPLADAARFRRLHVLAGDSNRCETSSWLKTGTILAVLAAVDAGETAGLERWRLADATAALRAVAADPKARLELAGDGTATALEVQRGYFDVAAGLAEPELAATWDRVLAAFSRDEPEAVATEVEWVAKRALLLEYRRRHRLAADDPRLDQVALAWHELGGLGELLEARGVLRRRTDPDAVAEAAHTPPATRAAARGAAIAAARAAGCDYSVDWQRVSVHGRPGVAGSSTLELPDPLLPEPAGLAGFVAGLAG